ncbi:ABC multidrug transporter B [Cladobotryum mycophilum]|uniref:ABC multidrug transporter B n=1 Tax=Cladobotryum mycophilum TaxID=491253 RepID=A0ABR0SS07_9HYPO
MEADSAIRIIPPSYTTQTPQLHTRLSLATGIANAVATPAAMLQSYMKDQRSIKPSDALILYFYACTILFAPQLRSLWLISDAPAPKAIWTTIFISTALIVLVESIYKKNSLHPAYKNVTQEQIMGFWGKSFFIWVLPYRRRTIVASPSTAIISKVPIHPLSLHGGYSHFSEGLQLVSQASHTEPPHLSTLAWPLPRRICSARGPVQFGFAGECWVLFIKIISQTALKMHSDLLGATTRAPYSVFHKSEIGSITNRFGQDMDLIDMRLPMSAVQFTTGATECLIRLIIICVLGKYLAAVIPILAVTIFLVQRPLYEHFVTFIQGVSTICAFKWDTVFQEKHGNILNRAQRPFYMLFCIQQWLQLVLDLIVGALAVIIVAVATFAMNSISPGALGVALVLVLQFNAALTQTIQSWTRLETSIGAVHRVQEFLEDTPAESSGVATVSSNWPPNGGVSFEDVTAQYPPQGHPALAQLDMRILPGEKLTVCGPSGSGKSSLIMAILGMLERSGGRVLIDGMDTSLLNGEDVRSHVNLIPQEPFFMPGTVRFNLDPRRSSDEAIESALCMVGLWEKMRQLLCLARAILVPGKLVILDEATSSVDERAEAIMQDTIDRQFKDCTVIAVVHRFAYIDRFDRVAVLNRGKLVECNTPRALLGRESAFRALYHAQHEA